MLNTLYWSIYMIYDIPVNHITKRINILKISVAVEFLAKNIRPLVMKQYLVIIINISSNFKSDMIQFIEVICHAHWNSFFLIFNVICWKIYTDKDLKFSYLVRWRVGCWKGKSKCFDFRLELRVCFWFSNQEWANN